MSFLVSDVKNRIESKMHGTTLNKIGDFLGVMQEAAGNLIRKTELRELTRWSLLDTPLFNDVYRYTAPSDLHKDRIHDIRPQVDRTVADNFTQTTGENFGLYKGNTNDLLSVEFDSGVKFLLISKLLTRGVNIHQMNSITGNGTWAVGGDANNLSTDTLQKVSGSASLRFDLDGLTGVGFLENSTMQAVNLSDEEDASTLFLRNYLPDASRFTNVVVRWGSSSSDYWEQTVTTRFDATSFGDGWNREGFTWSSITPTGSPNSSAVNYVKITFNYSTGVAINAVRVDELTASQGTMFEIGYQSNNLFRNASGTWFNKPIADTDLLNIEIDSYPLYLYELSLLVAQEMQGKEGRFDVEYFAELSQQANDEYGTANKSQSLKQTKSYYRMRK